jgi:ATP-dependent DNA helicase RecG
MDYLGLSDYANFYTRYLKPLLAEGKIALTIPDKPKSKNQKYVTSK